MKKAINKILIISNVILLSGCSCSYKHTKWHQDVERNNLSFTKLRYSLHDQDTLTIITYLKDNTEIDGYPCKEGWVHFTKSWEPKLFCLYENYSINNVELPGGTWIKLKPDSNIFSVVFPKNTFIDDYECKGGGGVTGVQTSFYNSGKLRSFFSDKPIIINGIKCKGGMINLITLHENGKLKSCKLDEDIIVEGNTIKKGSVIRTDALGKIIDYE